MTKHHDIDLMQHADGELALDGALDGEARAKVDAIGHLGEVVRGTAELAADRVPEAAFARMWGEIDKVLVNTAERAITPVPAQPVKADEAARRGFWGWLERHMGHVVTGVVSAGAVATVALIARSGDPEGVVNGGGGIDVRPVSMRSPVEIESMDTPDGTGMVLNLEDEDGHTTVIWVTSADMVEDI